MGPAYHPEWLVTFWLSTPGLDRLNPHYLLIVLAAGLIVLHFLRRKPVIHEGLEDREEQAFKHLLLRKSVIEEQIGALEGKIKAGDIPEADLTKKLEEYQHHLEQVKKELQEYSL